MKCSPFLSPPPFFPPCQKKEKKVTPPFSFRSPDEEKELPSLSVPPDSFILRREWEGLLATKEFGRGSFPVLSRGPSFPPPFFFFPPPGEKRNEPKNAFFYGIPFPYQFKRN